MQKAPTDFKPMTTLKSDNRVGLFLIPLKNYRLHLSGLQQRVAKVLTFYNGNIKGEARAAFKRYYEKLKLNYKIIDNDNLLIQVATVDGKGKYIFHQYKLVAARLKKEPEVNNVGITK